jgi:hypothetical protein
MMSRNLEAGVAIVAQFRYYSGLGDQNDRVLDPENVFSIFFIKMTYIVVILCGESFVCIPEA